MTSNPKLFFGSVLLIDDEASLVVVAREQLQRAGFDVATAYTVKEALTELKRRKFNAILLDLHLDGRSGAEVIEFLLKEKTPNTSTPVYVVSGQLRKEHLEQLQPRVSGFFVKPLNFAKLIRVLKARHPTEPTPKKQT